MSLLVRNPNIYYGTGRRRRTRRRRGRGILDVLRGVHDFVKKNKIISSVSGALSNVPGPIGNIASLVNKGSSAFGYGRRRRLRRRSGLVRRITVRRRRGGDLRSTLSSIHKFVKDKRLISSGLRHFLPKSSLHKAAAALGYGRKRRRVRRVRRVRRRRGGDLRSTLSSIHKFVKDKRLVSGALRHFLPKSNLHKAAAALGYGRRRRVHYRRRHHGGANFFSTSMLAAPKFG